MKRRRHRISFTTSRLAYEYLRSHLGLLRLHRIQSDQNNRYIKKIMIDTRIYCGSKFNLVIMIGRTRDRRVGLNPHLLTNGLVPSLLVHLS
jgi:hypothetical protein